MLIPFDDLFRRYDVNPPMVLHLGANTGQEAEVYHRHHIPKVIWVEALPELYRRLKTHVTPYPGQEAIQACLSDANGHEVLFNVASNGGQSSSILEFGTHSQEHPTVRCVRQVKMKTTRVDSILGPEDIPLGSFLNVDLQGAELLALKGMGQLLHRFDFAYVEVNVKELYKGCPLVDEIDDYLAGFGFDRKETKMTGNGWGDAFYVKVEMTEIWNRKSCS